MELMQLVYRSLAVEPPSARALQRILEVARRRNATEGLTGLLVHDQGCFVQWLEGPPEGLDRVWESI
uniref:BLUF domain-containing protein n=1 Tax=Stenotrophomonas maltophilia TaxID=40324 RepID=UPI0013DAEED6